MAGRPTGTGTGPARELTLAEVRRLSKCCDGRHEKRDRALVWLCVGAGLRVGEAVSLRLRDYAGDTLVVERGFAKGGRSRVVYVSAEARVHIDAYIRMNVGGAPNEALLRSQKAKGGEPGGLNANYGVRLFAKLFRLAGIEGASSHSCRRTHANGLRKAGADLLVIKTQLGHSNLSVTERYLEASPEEHREALARLKF